MGTIIVKTKRLEILEQSLIKKENLFNEKLENHINTVKQANGQPLNDKRNGQATLNKYDRQNESLRTLKDSIQKTKDAIEREEGKISGVENTKSNLPTQIVELIDNGTLIQWRKHPNTFFVEGVDKARILWDFKKKQVAHKYTSSITDKDQWKKFVSVFNPLGKILN